MDEFNQKQTATAYLIIWLFLVLATAVLVLINHMFAQHSQVAANIDASFAVNYLTIGWGIAFLVTFILQKFRGFRIKNTFLTKKPVIAGISFALGTLFAFLVTAAYRTL
jgi:hypothetical protein